MRQSSSELDLLKLEVGSTIRLFVRVDRSRHNNAFVRTPVSKTIPVDR
jgi:hypothetical protein